jgi:AcrR family transcriptional regulator
MTLERAYHHGSLREAALDAARQRVAERGHDALSMRDLATQLGVAASALYRHFSNRTALLMALADAVHGGLKLELERVTATQTDPWAALEEAGRHFLAFAARDRALFLMVYDDEVINAPDAESRMPALEQTYQQLLALVRRALPQASEAEARLRLIGFWSTLYGYASVRSHGALKSYMNPNLSDAAMEAAVLATALGPRPVISR